MKTFIIDVSKVIMDENNLFTGKATIVIPNVNERMEMMKQFNITTISEISFDDSAGIFQSVSKHIESVEINHPEIDGTITDIDELTSYSDGIQLFQKICQYVMNGLPMGKGLKLQ